MKESPQVAEVESFSLMDLEENICVVVESHLVSGVLKPRLKMASH